MNNNQDNLDSSWGVSNFDPWDQRITYENIWPIYQAMRDTAPVLHSDALGGFWSIVRYEEVRNAARDFRTISSKHALDIGQDNWAIAKSSKRLIETDPPDHTRVRKAMQAPFLIKSVGQFEEGIRLRVHELLDNIEELGTFDIVTDLAEPIPQEVLANVLGFDEETRKRNRELVLTYVHADLASTKAAHHNFWAFLVETIQERTNNPGNDFLSQLCMTEVDGDKFSEEELVGMLHGFALAGHHTAIDGISSMLRRVSDRELRKSAITDPALIPKIVDETLRCDAPIHLEGRSTTAEVTIGGVTIPAGESVALIYASANRDERQFENPDYFDPLRANNQNLAFGHGIHMCIGMHLARLEMKIILEEMLARFPEFELKGKPNPTGMVFGHHMGWDSMLASIR